MINELPDRHWDARLALHPNAPIPESVGVLVIAGEREVPGVGYSGRLANRIQRALRDGGFPALLVILGETQSRSWAEQIRSRAGAGRGQVRFTDLFDKVNFQTEVEKAVTVLSPTGMANEWAGD